MAPIKMDPQIANNKPQYVRGVHFNARDKIDYNPVNNQPRHALQQVPSTLRLAGAS